MNLILYYAAVFITNAGNSCAFIALGKYSLEFFGFASLYGSVLLLEQVKAVSLSYMGGHLADRFGARTVAVSCDVALFVSGAAMGGLALCGHVRPAILIAALVINLIKPFYSPAVFTLVREIAPSDALRKVNSSAAAAQQMGWIAGLAVAAWGMINLTPGWLISFDSLTYLGSALCLFSCVPLANALKAEPASVYDFPKSPWLALRAAAKTEPFIWMVVIGLQVNLIVAYNIGLFSLVAVRFPGHSSYLSWLEFAFAAAVALLALRGGRGLTVRTLGFAQMVQAVVLVALPFSHSIAMTAGLVACFAALSAHIFPLAFERLYHTSTGAAQGQVGAAKGVVQAIIALPLLITVNVLVDFVGLDFAYAIMGLVSGGLGLWFILARRPK